MGGSVPADLEGWMVARRLTSNEPGHGAEVEQHVDEGDEEDDSAEH